MDELLASYSRNFRQQLRNSANRLERLGKVQVLLAPDDISLDGAFEELVRLHLLRWTTASATFATDQLMRFHRALVRNLAQDRQLYLALLTIDGKIIAVRYDFVYANKMWCVQGGWDPDFQSARPGMFMTSEAIRWAIEQGLSEYDFLAGTHDYKVRWANDQRDLVALTVANPRALRGRAYGRLRKL